MEEGNYVPADSMQYYKARMMSPEIVEIGEESKSFPGSKDGSGCDVYVAVGKDDLGVLKWALDHAASPGSRVFLVHVFAPITFVTVDTVLIESNSLFKAILELIPVLNITCLVMGTKHPPSSSLWNEMLMMFFRQRRWKHGIAELIKKNAPDYCAVTIVHDGKKIEDCQQEPELVHPSQESSPQRTGLNSERNFFQCVCFTGKSN
ncbi:uncharacterized protein LOC111289968 isoform X3 [Durio zibethinus]|uniref:Uncharacterized protein LOC111289968 isoform X3 n=1 Tax=Durio zibethinus TaxID=66656 RepID=A0A6P5Y9J7_DURZI|nr:uncharacterized protein LOC111289968 isoform X3 [Durio zibethinus]